MIEIDTLRQISLFSGLSDEQCRFLEWGKERWLEMGEVLAIEGESPGYFWVLLEGEIHCTTLVGNRQIPWTTYEANTYFGHELILLDRPYPASARATCTCRLLEFDTEAFWKMLKLCPSINRELLVTTAQRSQNLDSVSMQAQKLISLGTLISGLARELSQPASVSRRATEQLQQMFQTIQPRCFDLAPQEAAQLNQIKLNLLDEIEQSTQRLSKVVQSAKDYAYLDRAPLQETDIHEGIENTLRMMGHRLNPGITVIREYDNSLPPICVYGSEINQVWTHLIENAIEAMAGRGTLTVRTSQAEDYLLIEVIDSGQGIPPEVQPYIFEQFFTTKESGQGTGLGLPIAYRVVVDRHQGQLIIDSQPGRTCFRVFLPTNLTQLATSRAW
jgi:signal transduction histidine kinase